MLAAVEFVADRDDRVFFDAAQKIGPQVAAALAERGVIGRAMPQGDILGFAPPLCLTREEADIVVKATADAVNERVCQPLRNWAPPEGRTPPCSAAAVVPLTRRAPQAS